MYIMSGPDLAQLRPTPKRRKSELKKVPGAVDVDTTLVAGKPEVAVRIDREKAADLGVQVADLAVDAAAPRRRRSRSRPTRRRASSTTSACAPTRRTAPTSRGSRLLTVPSSRLGSVPLADVVDLERRTGPAADQPPQPPAPGHVPGQHRARLRRGRGHRRLEKILKDLHLPAGYAVGAARAARRRWARAAQGFLLAFGLSFVFMYLILAAQFESWLHPITILLSLPLTLPFALISLHHLQAGARHLLDARHPGALRRREEERDPPDRPHQPPARRRACRATTRSCRPTGTGCGRS